jgi:hypothetical protein
MLTIFRRAHQFPFDFTVRRIQVTMFIVHYYFNINELQQACGRHHYHYSSISVTWSWSEIFKSSCMNHQQTYTTLPRVILTSDEMVIQQRFVNATYTNFQRWQHCSFCPSKSFTVFPDGHNISCGFIIQCF